jgi:hypothetical protein
MQYNIWHFISFYLYLINYVYFHFHVRTLQYEVIYKNLIFAE